MYVKHILGEKRVPAVSMVKSKFYSIQAYTDVSGNKNTDSKRDSALIFSLFVSKTKDVVHCIKISEVNPTILKRFFKRLKLKFYLWTKNSNSLVPTYEGEVSSYEKTCFKIFDLLHDLIHYYELFTELCNKYRSSSWYS